MLPFIPAEIGRSNRALPLRSTQSNNSNSRHPRGRIYKFRMGLSADWPRVFGEAAKLDKAVEIDGNPDRQDLSLDLVRQAAKEGCRISFGTDSHGPSQLRFMEFSAGSALLAGVKRERILNFMPADDLLAGVQKIRDYSKPQNRSTRVSSTKLPSGRHPRRIPR